jgi:hypothetical protein
VSMKIVLTPADVGSKRQHGALYYVYDGVTKKLTSCGPSNFDLEKRPEFFRGVPFGVVQQDTAFRPFGLTKHDTGFFIASNEFLFDVSDENISFTKTNGLFLGTHQIEHKDGVLYSANSSNDTISIINNDKVTIIDCVNKIVITDPQVPVDRNSCNTAHINSVTIAGGFLYYCMNNHTTDKDSEFWKINLSTFEHTHVFSGGRHCHNVVFGKNGLYTLSSATGELLKFDETGNGLQSVKICDPSLVFLRGLRFYNELLYIGASCNHDAIQTNENCFISWFDEDTNELVKFLEFSDAFSMNDFIIL